MYASSVWRPKTYATICDLPQELLLLILSHLKDWKYWLKLYCSCVCRCLRAACIELIDFRAVNVCEHNSPKHFTAFIKDHPRVATSIVKLRLAGLYALPRPTMSAVLVACILGQLPSLQTLTLNIMRFDRIDVTDVDASAPAPTVDSRPRRLKRLELNYGIDERSLLPEVFRIASLFEVEELDLGFSDCFDLMATSVPFSLPRPLHARSLSVNHTLRSKKHAAVMFDALSAHLSPGVLERLEVSVDSAEGIHSLGRLLSGPACSSLTHLDLKSQPPAEHYGLRYGWKGHKDPLQYEWSALNIVLCPRLESIVLHVYAVDPPSDMPLCSAVAGMLSQAPPTLRCPTLKVWGRAPKNLVNAPWFSLQDVDEALSVPSRFPKLEKLTVELYYNQNDDPGYTAACEAAFTAVHAAGKLDVVRM
ncbi:hypothetical protein V8D89_012933 [Ganoderma adspersum]